MSELLFADISGDASGDRPTLLLIHGFPFDHTMWRSQLSPLSKIGRVIAPDLNGFGKSKLSADDATQGLDMATYATALRDLLDSLEIDEPVVLCGFSMGGYILWQFAQRFPGRVRALVLCDTRADSDPAAAVEARLRMADEVFRTGAAPVAEAMLPKLLAQKTWLDQPTLVEQVSAMIGRASPAAISAAQRGMARRPDMQDALATFDWPALVVAGAEDAISPPEVMRQIARDLPQAKFCEIAEAGHLSPLENPAAFNAVLVDFVESL